MEWFADGLTFEEAAAMVALTAVGGYFDSPELYQSFLEDHYVQSKTVPLPLSGMINIDLVSEIEDYIRRIEDFLGSPFPTSDIILLVFVPDPDSYRGFYAAFATHYMYVAKGSLSSLPHELAHYYTAGPRWLVEGGAEFISNQVVSPPAESRICSTTSGIASSSPSSASIPWANISCWVSRKPSGTPKLPQC